jgi:hypothetical protein
MFVICIWLVIMTLTECVSGDSRICYVTEACPFICLNKHDQSTRSCPCSFLLHLYVTTGGNVAQSVPCKKRVMQNISLAMYAVISIDLRAMCSAVNLYCE